MTASGIARGEAWSRPFPFYDFHPWKHLCDNEADSNRRGIMIRMRTSHWNFRDFYYSIIPSLLLPVAVKPRELDTCAEPAMGLALSGQQSLLVSSMVPIPTHRMPTTPTRTLSRFISAIGTPSISIQNSTLLKVAL